ncbi:hypothetical protein Amal_03178 [Acetobacter malorum]|uniref:Uncharacterized protein n=1 Tax=Acetobacter malorum TaxID=178901 RepID=A0A177G8E6_9PROT|nr:hypothetical protein Amal_03178 [Acetobacter malorum]
MGEQHHVSRSQSHTTMMGQQVAYTEFTRNPRVRDLEFRHDVIDAIRPFELALIHKGCQRGGRKFLTVGANREEGIRVHLLAFFIVSSTTIAFGKNNFSIMDHTDGNTGHIKSFLRFADNIIDLLFCQTIRQRRCSRLNRGPA